MTEFPRAKSPDEEPKGLIEMPDFIKNQPAKAPGYDGFADFAKQDRNVPIDQDALSPFAKVKAEGSPYMLDELGRAVPIEGESVAATEQDKPALSPLEAAINADKEKRTAYTIPSRKDPKVTYRMTPTGETAPGLVKMAGPSSDDGKVYERWVTEAGYLQMRAEAEAAERVRAEHVGKGLVDVAEVAEKAGVEAPSVPETSGDSILKTKVAGVIDEIGKSIQNAGHFDPSSACSQRAGEIDGLLRGGITKNPMTIEALRSAAAELSKGSNGGRADRYDPSAQDPRTALNKARAILQTIRDNI